MILAVDTGTATLGWALVSRRGMVVDLGALLLPRDSTMLVHDDYVRRVEIQVDHLRALLPGVTLLVGEALSFARSAKATASVSLCWGMLIGVTRTLGVARRSVPPKRWQRALMGSKKRVDYDVLSSRITAHVVRTGAPRARSAVTSLSAAKRPHALDAVGIGIYTATIANLGGT